MKKFRYRAKSYNGQTVSGVVEAVDERSAVALLRERNLVVVHISSAEKFGLNIVSGLLKRVGLSQLTNFTRQLATMISAGLSLPEALGILQSQSQGYMGIVLAEVKRSVEGGDPLAKAMAAHNGVFDKVYVSLITAGEKAGVMDKILLRLADTLEKRREFQSKVKGAMIYPSIIFFGMIGVVFVMMVYVIPQLADLYKEFGADLPWMTNMLITMSNFTITYWWIMLVLVIAGVAGWRIAMKNREIKKKWESVKFALPVFGPLYEQILMTELTRTMSLLTAAGVPIVQSLTLVADGTPNLQYEDSVRSASRMVEKGIPLSQAFGSQTVFPPILGQMLSVGEETGKVDEIMERISIYFESESEQKVKGLTSAIEPLVLILLGGGVGFLVFAIVIPIYNLTNTL